MTDIHDLRTLSEAATPGRWYYVQGHGWCCRTDDLPYALPIIRDAATYDGPPSDDEIFIRALVNWFRANYSTQSRPEAELPELPECLPDAIAYPRVYTAAQMTAYGQQCAATRTAEVGGVAELVKAARRVEQVWQDSVGNATKLHLTMFGVDGAGAQLSIALEKFPSTPGSEVKS